MKKLEARPVFHVNHEGIVVCPHCRNLQDNIDEYQSDVTYECEFCWEHYTVPMTFIEKNQMDQQYGQFAKKAELSSLEERVSRLEKELGIKK